jgi:hypothetical protein
MHAYEFKSGPDYEHTLVWVNPVTPDLREEQRFDRYPGQAGHLRLQKGRWRPRGLGRADGFLLRAGRWVL